MIAKEKVDVKCEEVHRELRGFKEYIKEDIAELRKDFGSTSEAINKIGMDVAILNVNISLLLKKSTPCEAYDKRISELENTKASIGGGWKLLAVIGGIIIVGCSVGGLAISIIGR